MRGRGQALGDTSSRGSRSARGSYKRRAALSDTIEAMIDEFARHSPGYDRRCCCVVDTTPVECCRSRRNGQAGRREQPRRRARQRRRLRLLRQPQPLLLRLPVARACSRTDGTPRALALTAPKVDEREVCLPTARAGALAVGHVRRHRRQGLRRPRLRGRARCAERGDRAARAAKTRPAAARTWRRSANASSRSSGPPRTSSRSSATAPAPCTPSEPARLPLRSPCRRARTVTTASAGQARA